MAEDEGDGESEHRPNAPSFETVLPAVSLKALARVLQFLGRIGDDLFLEVDRAKVLLSTINASRSAFAIATLKARVFERHTVRGPPNAVVRCKIFLKAFASVFKAKPGLDNVERCVLSCAHEPAGVSTFVRVKLHCKHGIVKTFNVIYESSDPVHAIYDRQQCSHTWQASPRAVTEWLQHFFSRQDEISMSCALNAIKLRTSCGFGGANSHDEVKRIMHTEICLDSDDFDVFQIPSEVSLTFNLKEFKGILALAEALQLPVSTHFQEGGSPILFAIDTATGINAELVLATVSEVPAIQSPTGGTASMATSSIRHAQTDGLAGFSGAPSTHVSETSGIQPSGVGSSAAQMLGPRKASAAHGYNYLPRHTLERRTERSRLSAQTPLMHFAAENISPPLLSEFPPRTVRDGIDAGPNSHPSFGGGTDESSAVHASHESGEEGVPPSPPRKRGRSLFH